MGTSIGGQAKSSALNSSLEDLEFVEEPDDNTTQKAPMTKEDDDTKSRVSISSQARRQHQRRVLLVGSFVLLLLGVGLPVFFLEFGSRRQVFLLLPASTHRGNTPCALWRGSRRHVSGAS